MILEFYSFPIRLWEINLYENEDAPIALDKLWAHYAYLRKYQKYLENYVTFFFKTVVYR